MVGSAARTPSVEHLQWAAALVLGLGLLGLATWVRLMGYYGQAQNATERRSPTSSLPARPLVGWWPRLLAGPRHGAGPVAVCLLMLRRDQDLRLRTWPALAPVFVFFCIGLVLKELDDPLGGLPGQFAFSIVTVQMAVIAVPSIVHNLCFSRDHGGAWIFLAAPRRHPAVFAEATRKAACYGVVLPVLVVMWAAFSFLWRDPLHAAIHCGLGWLAVVAAGHFTLWGMDYPLPFARPAARGVASGAVFPYLAGVGTLAAAVGGAEYVLRESRLGLAALGAVLLFLALGIPRLSRQARSGKEASIG